MLSSHDLAAIVLTLQLATVTTVVLLVLATPLAWWLSRSQSRWLPLWDALFTLPLILPPTVIGFYLLLAFAPAAWPGQLWQQLTGQQLAFSFAALVIGSVVYSLPFALQPLRQAFMQLSNQQLEAASTLGAGPLDRLLHLVLPAARSGLIAAAALSFAHTIGEFGVVLMIGGNIPGQTQVVSIALFDRVETLQYAQAHWLAAGLLLFATVLLTALYTLQRQAHWQRRPLL